MRTSVVSMAIASVAITVFVLVPARAEESSPPRYELYFSPRLEAETGARLVSSAVTGTGAGEERLFRPLGPGAGGIAARGARALVWDAPVAWWFGVALHESFGHGGRGREFHTSPGVHLGSPWGGRDSYASFDLEGTSSEERLYIYAGGTEANTLAATFLERRAVEGVRMRPIELFYLASNRLVASDYVLRTTPDPADEPADFYSEYQGGGDVANYLGLLHELHGSGSGITPSSTDDTIQHEYERLRRQAYWNLLDPGLWWALASALRLTVRGDDTAPVPLPHAGRFRFLPVLSSEWTPSGGEASLEWIMAPLDAVPLTAEPDALAPSSGLTTRRPRTFSMVARRGAGPSGSFGALGTAAEDIVTTRSVILGGAAEVWHDPRNGLGGGVRLRTRLTRGSLRGLYFDVGGKSQGYWIGQPATPGLYAAVGLLYVP
ncbi:MAG TPA: hypothetical protein VKF61_11670 [Candidatus Polarisedimenticolia bacterium]|nr:hypothetical protein [Candidatus Polarisedimenticolia bacterium]